MTCLQLSGPRWHLSEQAAHLGGPPVSLPGIQPLTRHSGVFSLYRVRSCPHFGVPFVHPLDRAQLNHLHAICVARHSFIAEHFARFFSEVGVDTVAAVGLEGAVASARRHAPDVVVCEYELLTALPLDAWEGDQVLRCTPVVGVSLTRRPDEVNPLDSNGIAGFLYLPTLNSADARRLLYAAAARPTYIPGLARGVVTSTRPDADRTRLETL